MPEDICVDGVIKKDHKIQPKKTTGAAPAAAAGGGDASDSDASEDEEENEPMDVEGEAQAQAPIAPAAVLSRSASRAALSLADSSSRYARVSQHNTLKQEVADLLTSMTDLGPCVDAIANRQVKLEKKLMGWL